MPRRFVVLGATGDLMERYLAPAFAELAALGSLGSDVEVVGVGRRAFDDDTFRERMLQAIQRSGRSGHAAERFRYCRGEATDPDVLRSAAGDAPVVLYAALPPNVMADVVRAAGRARIHPASAIALEKPFGHDLASARELDALLAERFEESRVFRVDHFLALDGVLALLGLRAGSPALDVVLRRENVRRVSITWDETLGLEGRGGYYDGTGAVADMMQSHLLQVLAMLACEPPSSGDARAIHAARLAVLERTTVTRVLDRARYGEGELRGKAVPAYVDEEGVDPENETETLASVELHVDLERWRDVPFVLRTGKALARDRREVRVALARGGHEADLVFDLDDAGAERSPYARVLEGIARGDRAHFISGPEAEVSWRIVEPVLAAFREGRVPLRTYPAGSEE